MGVVRGVIVALLVVLIFVLATAAIFSVGETGLAAGNVAYSNIAPWWIDPWIKILEIVLKFAQACLWPAIVAFLLVLLRPHLGVLAGRVTKLLLPGGSIEFSESLAVAAEKLKEEEQKRPSESRASPATAPERQQEAVEASYRTLSTDYPEAAVASAFVQVEIALRDTAALFLDPSWASESKLTPRAVVTIIEELRADKVISKELSDVLNRLRSLRNKAALGGSVDISEEEALEYRSVAERAVTALKYLTK